MVTGLAHVLRAVALTAAVLATAAPVHAQRHYLLRYAAGSEAERLVDSIGGTDAKRLSRVGSGSQVAAFAKTLPTDFWRGVPGVEHVSEGRPLQRRGGVPDDPTYREQWNLHRIDAVGAWDYSTGGSTVAGEPIVIGVIELDGFDLRHPDLRGNYYVNPGERPGNGRDDDGNGYVDDVTGVNFLRPDDNGFSPHPHATHVAGILGARGDDGSQAAGLNWNARLLPFQIETSVEWVLALDYLTDLRARYNRSGGAEGAYVTVANCSFGADDVDCGDADYREVDAAIARAGRVGILTVAATSNDVGDVDRRPSVASSCASEYLVTVTASDREDDLLPGAGFSASRIDVAAPGATFGSVDAERFGRIENSFSGTSGAAPQVAGTIGLMYAVACERLLARSLSAPGAVAAEMKTYLLGGVDVSDGLVGRVASGGRLNARRAVEAVIGSADCVGGEVIVQVTPGSAAPDQITGAGVSLALAEPIAEDWGLYRYLVRSGATAEALALAQASAGVERAGVDRPLLRSGTRFGFGEGADFAAAIGSAFVGGTSEAQLLPLLVAFDIGFDAPRATTLGRRNADARELGVHGTAFTEIAARVAHAEERSVLAYRGYRLSDLLAAAAESLRPGGSGGPGGGVTLLNYGAPVFASATQLTPSVDTAGTAGLLGVMLDTFASAGVIPVLSPGLLDAAGVPEGTGVLSLATPAHLGGIAVPGSSVNYGAGTASDCLAEGVAAQVAQLAGAAAIVSTVACPGTLTGPTPSAVADALVCAAEGNRGRLDVLGAARLLLADCEATATEGIDLVFPSLIGRGGDLRVIYRATAARELGVYDAAGRLLSTTPVAPGDGAKSLTVDVSGLAAGTYFLSLVGSEGTSSQGFVVVD